MHFKVKFSSVRSQLKLSRKVHNKIEKIVPAISQNCTIVNYISCDTSVLSSQTNFQENKITGLNAFHPQIKSIVRRFNKNKIVSTLSKTFIFKTWVVSYSTYTFSSVSSYSFTIQFIKFTSTFYSSFNS